MSWSIGMSEIPVITGHASPGEDREDRFSAFLLVPAPMSKQRLHDLQPPTLLAVGLRMALDRALGGRSPTRPRSPYWAPGTRECYPDRLGAVEWNEDDAHRLSLSFDSALERSAVEDIERLSHLWLICDPPQVIELNAGRQIN